MKNNLTDMKQNLVKQEQMEDGLNSPCQSEQLSSPNQRSKESSPSKHSQHVIIVSNFSEESNEKGEIVDPLQQQIASMKITQNLIKEINFTASINKFDNFQDLLHKKFEDFNSKIQKVSTNQKDIFTRMKSIQNSAANIDSKKSKKIDENKIAKDVKDVIIAREQIIKYKKVSYAMILALQQIQRVIDKKIQQSQKGNI